MPPLLGHRALQGHLLFARDRVAYVHYFVKTIAMSEDERHYRVALSRGRSRASGGYPSTSAPSLRRIVHRPTVKTGTTRSKMKAKVRRP